MGERLGSPSRGFGLVGRSSLGSARGTSSGRQSFFTSIVVGFGSRNAQSACTCDIVQTCMNHSFLIFATEWKSGRGGLSTFNRHLCTALARAGCGVTCIVADCVPEDIAEASARGVQLEAPPETPGLRKACQQNVLLVGLAKQEAFDVVVGHGRITGPHALAVRNRDYPKARHVHFVHMDAKAIDWEKAYQSSVDPAVPSLPTHARQPVGSILV